MDKGRISHCFEVGDTIKYFGPRQQLTSINYTIKEVKEDHYVATDGTLIPFKFQEYYKIVDKELEEEIERYLKESLAVKFPTLDVDIIKSDIRYIAHHFTEWQEQRDSVCYKDAFEDGCKWKYEEMLKGAVDGYANTFKNGYIHFSGEIDENLTDVKFGDKVKLIVIKQS